MSKIRNIIILLFATCFQNVFAQQVHQQIDTSAHFIFHFRVDKHILDKGYMNNNEILAQIDSLFKDGEIINSLDSIQVVATSSPDGVLEHNRWLAKLRSKAIKGYIVWKYPNIDQWSIHTSQIDENWTGLRELVKADPNVPARDKVLSVIDTDINSGTKKWRLERIQGGESWKYIKNNFLKELRSGATCLVLYKTTKVGGVKTETEVKPIPEPIPEPIPKSIKTEIKTPIQIEKPLFAIKTNLIADVLSVVNVEIEVPIGKRWSVSGELTTPWWQMSDSNFTMQLLSGSGTVKYWFGDRNKHDVMTGWSLGVYGGGGKYDIQLFDKEGSQGEFFNAGLQVGYAHKIGKRLRLEYSMNLGFLRNNYKEYTKVRDTKYGDIKVFEYPWEVKQLDWFGPTNAKVSLVWLLNYKTNRKGGKR